jgi:hypothetical protein
VALADLQARLAAIDAELAALNSTKPGGGIDIDGGGMGTVQHVEYRKSLYEERALLRQEIEVEQGGWEIPMVGRPD